MSRRNRPSSVELARQSFARSQWAAAYRQLAECESEVRLEPEELHQYAVAAYLIGLDFKYDEIMARAFRAFSERDRPAEAARCAIWLAMGLFGRGEGARGGGWLGRAQSLLQDIPECVEHGYLQVPLALKSLIAGEFDESYRIFTSADDIGKRFGDADLLSLARHGRGRALIRLGQVAGGMQLLDEAMVAVTEGEVSPIIAGTIYCSVIDACSEVFDVRRAGEWTDALATWCDSQPDLVPYRGECLLRRAELLRLRGQWTAAEVELERAQGAPFGADGPRILAALRYQLGELYRVRGQFAAAEREFAAASAGGRTPYPGLALLRLAQGQTDAAHTAIRSAMAQAGAQRARLVLLPALAEICLAAGDLSGAAEACAELQNLDRELDSPMVHALALRASGALHTRQGSLSEALAELRESSVVCRQLHAPYDEAKARLLLALACDLVGDSETRELELRAAAATFGQLDARPDLAVVEKMHGTAAAGASAGLTRREVQVLRVVASGKSNREVAEALQISEKTVARHISNILRKLALPSRSAATAYAFRHKLV